MMMRRRTRIPSMMRNKKAARQPRNAQQSWIFLRTQLMIPHGSSTQGLYDTTPHIHGSREVDRDATAFSHTGWLATRTQKACIVCITKR